VKSKIPTIAEVMTAYPVVVDIRDRLTVAQDLMSTHGIRHLPVISAGTPISVLSDREVYAALARKGQSDSDITVGDVCAMEGYMVDVSTALDTVLEIMGERKMGSVLVTAKGRVAGIFTAVDACKQLCKLLRAS
jgi:acetoin utilization protein AcuB